MIFWTVFHFVILSLIILDYKISSAYKHLGIKLSYIFSIGWIILALLFNMGVFHFLGSELGIQFFTGYLIEKSLSVDNLLVIFFIFTHFKVPLAYQHRILFCGVNGALAFRLLFILTGISLIHYFHWITYVLGAVLCITAWMLLRNTQERKVKGLFLARFVSCFFSVAKGSFGGRFWVKIRGKWKMTTLFLTLLTIEGADLLFAIDSIPAIFAISHDPMIVYTSNVFAIVGLRELYFVVAHHLTKLKYISFGLAAILFFVGFKMLTASFFTLSVPLSLGVIVTILGVTWLFSLRHSR